MGRGEAASTTPEMRWNGEAPLRLLVGPYVHEEHCAYMDGAFDGHEVVTFGPWEGSDLCIRGIVPLEEILARLPVTLEITMLALAFALLASFPLGILAARAQGGFGDVAVRLVSIVGLTLPSFWVGVLMLYAASIWLPAWPTIGYVPFGEDWYGYSSRRLKENPAMAGMIARAVLTGQ